MIQEPGLFISLEGIDGSGKSTLAKGIYKHLMLKNISVYLTAEPTDSIIGNLIRKLLRQNCSNKSDALTELFLFSADRSMHICDMSRHLEIGEWVLCDRYVDSTNAYQGNDVKILKTIYTINSELLEMLKPDLTILLDLDPEESLQRINSRERDCFEQLDFLKMVRARYLAIARQEPDRFVILEGNQGPAELSLKAISAIELCWLSKKKAMLKKGG